jgi:hypothetical protein
LLFPVDHPEFFDAVNTNAQNWVTQILVKTEGLNAGWIWGALRMPGKIFRQLHQLWIVRGSKDQYLGTVLNAHIAEGARWKGVRAGEVYVDVGTLNGYREAIRILGNRELDNTKCAADSRGRVAVVKNVVSDS